MYTGGNCLTLVLIYHSRVKSNPKNAINEHYLARFLDFVIWGHEHECLVDPQVKYLKDGVTYFMRSL